MHFQVLTKDEAAERANISKRLLETQIRAGVGPAITRIGSTIRIRTDELQAWLERCTASRGG